VIPVEVRELRKGDVFKVTEDSRRTYTVTYSQLTSDGGEFYLVKTRESGDLTMPPHTPLVAVSMYRPVKVRCLAARHQGGPVEVLFDMATGTPLQGVLCGDCNNEISAEVLAATEQRQPKRGDRVLVGNGGQSVIRRFVDEDEVVLGNGRKIREGDLKYLHGNVWQYEPEDET
jgi:hypothetical protein